MELQIEFGDSTNFEKILPKSLISQKMVFKEILDQYKTESFFSPNFFCWAIWSIVI
jgi:hypothetical protein